MIQRTLRAGALVLAVVMAVGACTDIGGGPNIPPPTSPLTTAPATTSTPSSSAPATTSASRSPTVTYDQALAQEAMKVNQAQRTLEGQYFKEGGWPRGLAIPNELEALMMDEGLARTVEGLNQTWEGKVKWQSGDGTMSNVHVADVPPHKDSLIALRACRDGRSVKNIIGDEQTPSHGALILHTSYYKRDTDGTLKMSYFTGKRVESCGS